MLSVLAAVAVAAAASSSGGGGSSQYASTRTATVGTGAAAVAVVVTVSASSGSGGCAIAPAKRWRQEAGIRRATVGRACRGFAIPFARAIAATTPVQQRRRCVRTHAVLGQLWQWNLRLLNPRLLPLAPCFAAPCHGVLVQIST